MATYRSFEEYQDHFFPDEREERERRERLKSENPLAHAIEEVWRLMEIAKWKPSILGEQDAGTCY